MKSKKIRLGILGMALIFGMMVVSCDNNTTSGNGNGGTTNGGSGDTTTGGGNITITGIPATYNGRWAGFQGESNTHFIMGMASISINTQTHSGTLVQISGGSVTLPAWSICIIDDEVVQRFSGNTTVAGSFLISTMQTGTFDEIHYSIFSGRHWESVVFSSGNVTLTWASGEPW